MIDLLQHIISSPRYTLGIMAGIAVLIWVYASIKSKKGRWS